MAQRIQVLLVCDMHGDDTRGDETVSFSLNGSAYEIDLCSEHAANLRDALSPYIGGARRAGTGVSAGRRPITRIARTRTRPDREQTAAIRDWARRQGKPVSDRGRIPAEIMAEFEAAHR
jgi:hypothetical protein